MELALQSGREGSLQGGQAGCARLRQEQTLQNGLKMCLRDGEVLEVQHRAHDEGSEAMGGGVLSARRKHLDVILWVVGAEGCERC